MFVRSEFLCETGPLAQFTFGKEDVLHLRVLGPSLFAGIAATAGKLRHDRQTVSWVQRSYVSMLCQSILTTITIHFSLLQENYRTRVFHFHQYFRNWQLLGVFCKWKLLLVLGDPYPGSPNGVSEGQINSGLMRPFFNKVIRNHLDLVWRESGTIIFWPLWAKWLFWTLGRRSTRGLTRLVFTLCITGSKSTTL